MTRCKALLVGLLLASSASAQDLEAWSVEVGGVERRALVRIPEASLRGDEPSAPVPAPVVFAWHGHGGRAAGFARRFGLHEAWPEAIVVYPQGLPTPSKLVDPQGKRSGWQLRPGDQGDRDLALFDSLLERLRAVAAVDEERLHSTGHSNGGGFTYLLLKERGQLLASVSPSASGTGRGQDEVALVGAPVLHAGASDDGLVRWEWQEATLDLLRRSRSCGEGVAWELDERVVRYPARTGGDVLVFEHGGGHRHHRDHAQLAVRFFQTHPRRENRAEPAEPVQEGSFLPTDSYRVLELRGFTVRLSPELDAEHELRDPVLELLGAKLLEVERRLPASALEQLRGTELWMELDDERVPGGVYHPSREWLSSNGYNPDLAGCIQFGNARNFLRWTLTQPFMVVHELSHAFHHKVLGYGDEEVRGAYEAARASGSYERVLHFGGGEQRAYAMNNPQEYFAELSEAYFGTNDFQPFVRPELRRFDPRGFAMVESAWKR